MAIAINLHTLKDSGLLSDWLILKEKQKQFGQNADRDITPEALVSALLCKQVCGGLIFDSIYTTSNYRLGLRVRIVLHNFIGKVSSWFPFSYWNGNEQ